MCRAVKVLCVAPEDEVLEALRRATTAAEWELTPGATDETDADRDRSGHARDERGGLLTR